MMKSEGLVPFFVYDKNKREAYLIVLTSKNKQLYGEVDYNGKRTGFQEGPIEWWSSRSTLGA